MFVASLMREKRKALGLTQKKLAVNIGAFSDQFVSNLERGADPFPAKYLRPVGDALNIDKSEMLEAYLSDERDKFNQAWAESEF